MRFSLAQTPSRAGHWISLTLLAAAILVYSQMGNFAFVSFDDPDYVARNPHVRGGLTADGIARAFTSGSKTLGKKEASHRRESRFALAFPLRLGGEFVFPVNPYLLFNCSGSTAYPSGGGNSDISSSRRRRR